MATTQLLCICKNPSRIGGGVVWNDDDKYPASLFWGLNSLSRRQSEPVKEDLDCLLAKCKCLVSIAVEVYGLNLRSD